MPQILKGFSPAIAKLEVIRSQARANHDYRLSGRCTKAIKYLRHLQIEIKGLARHLASIIEKDSKRAIKERRSPSLILYGDTSHSDDPLKKLKKSTLRIRRQKGIKRGPSFILRETSSQIFHPLKIVVKGNTLEVTGADEKLVKYHSEGANITVFGKHSAKLPARPFIGIDSGHRDLYERWVAINKKIQQVASRF